MNIAERIRSLVRRDPFLPFVIQRRNGESVRVTLPEQVFLPPGHGWLEVYAAASGDRDFYCRIDLTTVSDVLETSNSLEVNAPVTVQKFDELLNRRPFDPFTIYLADGGTVAVKSPEFVSRTQGGRTIMVSTGGETTEFIDLLLVSRISTGVRGNGAASRTDAGG